MWAIKWQWFGRFNLKKNIVPASKLIDFLFLAAQQNNGYDQYLVFWSDSNHVECTEECSKQ